MILVSSCIAGVACRHNAASNYDANLMKYINEKYIHACPELLAGFGIPRKPCEIIGGGGEDVLAGNAQVIDIDGVDVTDKILFGVQRALRICLKNGVTKAYLQARSPTCGYGSIYDGSFSATLRRGNGVFSALLVANGIKVIEAG